MIDARTGVTELGGVTTSLLVDELVCLMAHNRENREGARAVLRSVAAADRPAGASPVRILPVVARLPQDLPAWQRKLIVETIQGYLNEPAEDLAQILSAERVYALHSEPGLGVVDPDQAVSIDSGLPPPLFDDYLFLFERLLPKELGHKLSRCLLKRRENEP